jgi:glycosyltransferase involved in cell wall biosynthesis
MDFKVAVIIPNYNHSAFLKRRIESVLNQTYPAFEVVILDDCSTDDSRTIIEQFRHHPLVNTIIYNDHNSKSPFKQWLKGIAATTAPFIWIAESDDYCEPAFLETMMACMMANTANVLAYCGSNVVNEENTILDFEQWGKELNLTKWEKDYQNNGADEIRDYLAYKNIIVNASAVIFKRAAFETISPALFINLKYAGDWMIWVNLLNQGAISYVAEKLNYFRIHHTSTRSLKSINDEILRIKEYFTIINYIQNTFELKPETSKHKWIIDEWISKLPLFSAKNILIFLVPPFSLKYKRMFYAALYNKLKQRLRP